MIHAVELPQDLSSSSPILQFSYVCTQALLSTRRNCICQNIERSLKFETKKKQHQASVMNICR